MRHVTRIGQLVFLLEDDYFVAMGRIDDYGRVIVVRDELVEPMPNVNLTEREQQVIRLIAKDLPNKLIADQLRVSEHMAKFHVDNAITKLGARTRVGAVVEAIRRGLVRI